MRTSVALAFALLPTLAAAGGAGAVRLRSPAAEVRVDLAGGVLADFRLADDASNPLAGMGHFLCLDRWGPPSAAEAKSGMPFHGEAAKVAWQVVRAPAPGRPEAEMTAVLPLAGLAVRRELRLHPREALLEVREEVTNRNPLGRILNIVQHPTIGAPFLDPDTRVDAAAGRGFMQSSPLPNPERPEVRWPDALQEGRRVDLRRLHADPNPNVVSFAVEGEPGWTTACAPTQRLLIGYVWRRSEYPWFNAWRHVENGKPALRGLEFGTTGLHQPFPALVAKGRIFGLPLYVHLDAGETRAWSYAAFLLRTPPGFAGVRSVRRAGERLEVRERGGRGRVLTVPCPAFLR